MTKLFRLTRRAALLGFGLICALDVGTADAATMNIVALGASNTNGHGVGRDLAFPARLEAMLRAKGYDAHVTNQGIDGDTTAGMLNRMSSAVPDGTQLVILDKAPANDRQKGMADNSDANISAIVSQLHARGIKTIVITSMHVWGGQRLQVDGLHLTAEGHSMVAARLLPLVIASIGKPR